MADEHRKTDEYWKSVLTPEQFRITRKKGTEPSFSGEYNDCKTEGTYLCVCCGQALFASATKFDSGAGWPSFWAPLEQEVIELKSDRSLFFMPRTEVLCARCGAHLGHVFDDGPAPTGQRYCLNSLALKLKPK